MQSQMMIQLLSGKGLLDIACYDLVTILTSTASLGCFVGLARTSTATVSEHVTIEGCIKYASVLYYLRWAYGRGHLFKKKNYYQCSLVYKYFDTHMYIAYR